MDADGTNPRRLTNNSATDRQPAWSPNGRMIAFETSRDGNLEIDTMNADGTNPRRLTDSPGLDVEPAWSPDGRQIAFASTRDDPNPSTCSRCDFGIYTMNADGTNQTRLGGNGVSGVDPVWSPDGAKIAFDWSAQIYTINADGTSQVNTSGTNTGDYRPDWSPNGQKIVFEGNSEFLIWTTSHGCKLTMFPRPRPR